MTAYQPKTGARCTCKPGVYRDNCPACEGTGWQIDFAAIRARVQAPKPHNNNCDGGHCTTAIGEVRVYPLGAGGNLILCRSCFEHENRYRYSRGRDTGQLDKWPQIDWNRAETYGGAQ